MFNLRKYLYFLSTISLVILLNTNSHSAETVGLDTAKEYSKDLVKLMMSGKKNKALIVNALNKIEEECCSETFEEKNHDENVQEEQSNDLKEFGVDSDSPDLFSSESENSSPSDLLNSEDQEDEDDLEIPAFLRRQKN